MEQYMLRALDLAKIPGGKTAPNPQVGAVVTKEGRILGEGCHGFYGGPHAEVEALKNVGDCRGATIYVTLEPCSHQGKTPPCTDLLINSGISRVVAAMEDPNPLVSGRGFAQLRQAGIEVITGVLGAEARELNEAFIKHVTSKMPFLALKLALSLDGKVSARDGSSQWITGPESREEAHGLRHHYQAIMVGVGTAQADNPRLDCRRPGALHQPAKIVLDPQGKLSPQARLVASGRVIVITGLEPYPLKADNLEVIRLEDPYDLRAALTHLGDLGINGVLAEGGGKIASALIEAHLVDKYYLFYGPKLLGGNKGFTDTLACTNIAEAITLRPAHFKQLGQDLLAVCYPGEVN